VESFQKLPGGTHLCCVISRFLKRNRLAACP